MYLWAWVAKRQRDSSLLLAMTMGRVIRIKIELGMINRRLRITCSSKHAQKMPTVFIAGRSSRREWQLEAKRG